MDIDKLESFLILAEVKHFAKASEQLYISQPALSKRIQTLENELNVQLFNRIDKKVFLTIEGEAFKKFAEEIIASYYSAKEYIKQIENLEEGTLNFGATNFIGVYLMPKLISLFHKQFPKIKINMVINSSKNLLKMLHKNQLEFIFLSDYVINKNDSYIIKNYINDSLKLIVGNKHRLYGKSSCSLFDVVNDLYITKEPYSSQSKFLSTLFKKFNFDFKNKLFITNQEAIKEAVINNLGIAILSTNSFKRELENGLISSLSFSELEIKRDIHCIYIKNKLLTPAAREFIKSFIN